MPTCWRDGRRLLVPETDLGDPQVTAWGGGDARKAWPAASVTGDGEVVLEVGSPRGLDVFLSHTFEISNEGRGGVGPGRGVNNTVTLIAPPSPSIVAS